MTRNLQDIAATLSHLYQICAENTEMLWENKWENVQLKIMFPEF